MTLDAGSRHVAVQPAAAARPAAERAAGWLLIAAAAEFGVLAITGAWLLAFYRPTSAQAWGDIRGLRHSHTVTAVGAVRWAHRWTAHAMIPTLLAVAVVGVVLAATGRRPGSRHGLTAAVGIGAMDVVLLGSFTGFLLPWDQLALRAVTVGTNMMGYRPVISGTNVQFVLIGGARISLATLRWWLLVHVVMAPAVLVVLGGVMGRRVGRHRPPRHTGVGS